LRHCRADRDADSAPLGSLARIRTIDGRRARRVKSIEFRRALTPLTGRNEDLDTSGLPINDPASRSSGSIAGLAQINHNFFVDSRGSASAATAFASLP
jgi:hypothetical protein